MSLQLLLVDYNESINGSVKISSFYFLFCFTMFHLPPSFYVVNCHFWFILVNSQRVCDLVVSNPAEVLTRVFLTIPNILGFIYLWYTLWSLPIYVLHILPTSNICRSGISYQFSTRSLWPFSTILKFIWRKYVLKDN